MTDVTIVNLDVEVLEEAANNPNVMPASDFDLLCRAMKAKGHLQPILVRKLPDARGFRVIDGHHRLKAAKVCEMKQVASVLIECTDAEEPILRLAMNKLRGDVDLTSAGHIMKELQEAGVGLDELLLTGFSANEIEDLVRAVSVNVDTEVSMALPASDYEPEDDDTGAAKPLVLEIPFTNLADMKKAKKGLKRAAGKGKDLAVGLLRLLGEEQSKEAV